MMPEVREWLAAKHAVDSETGDEHHPDYRSRHLLGMRPGDVDHGNYRLYVHHFARHHQCHRHDGEHRQKGVDTFFATSHPCDQAFAKAVGFVVHNSRFHIGASVRHCAACRELKTSPGTSACRQLAPPAVSLNNAGRTLFTSSSM